MSNYALILEDLKLQVYLGVTVAERSKKQTVLLYIKINFTKIPLASKTRKISDAICYDVLAKKIQKFCGNKKFVLLEELGMQLLFLLKKNIPKNHKLHLRVAKQRPLPELQWSVFEIEQGKCS